MSKDDDWDIPDFGNEDPPTSTSLISSPERQKAILEKEICIQRDPHVLVTDWCRKNDCFDDYEDHLRGLMYADHSLCAFLTQDGIDYLREQRGDFAVFFEKLKSSPLEKIFISQIIKYVKGSDYLSIHQDYIEHRIGKSLFRIVPQFRIENFRVDFLMMRDKKYFVVELDGHAYHSERKDLMRDKSRDRRLQELGYKVFRYTWEDIWLNPEKSITELYRIILNDRNG